MAEATHWVMIPCTIEERRFVNNLPLLKFNDALAKFEAIGKILDGPWFHRFQEGDQILDGRLVRGPGLVYFARLEVKDVRAAASDSTSESPEVGSS